MLHLLLWYITSLNLTFILGNWWISLLISFILWSLNLKFEIEALAIIVLGTLSALTLRKAFPKSIDVHFLPANQFTILYIFIEWLIFIFFLSGLVIIDDSSVYLWLVQACIHGIGIFALYTLSGFSIRRFENSQFKCQNYYLTWGAVNVITDVAFAIFVSFQPLPSYWHFIVVAILIVINFIFNLFWPFYSA